MIRWPQGSASRAAGLMVIEKLAGLASSLFVGIAVARYLGPDGFGQLSYALAWMAIGSVFSQAGLTRILIARFVREQSYALTLGSALSIQAGGTLVGCIVVALGLTAMSDDRTLWHVSLLMSGIVFAEAVGPYRDLAMSRGRSSTVALIGIAVLLLSSVARLLGIHWALPLAGFALLAGAERLTWAVATVAMVRAAFSERPSVGRHSIGTLCAQGWPVLVANLSSVLYSRVDLLLLERMADTAQVGLYASTSRLAGSFPMLAVAVAQAFYPTLVKLQDADAAAYERRHLQLASLLGCPVMLIAFLAIWQGETMVTWLLGAKFAGAGPLLGWQMLTAAVMCPAVLRAGYLTSIGATRWLLLTTFASLGISVALNTMLIPVHGALGACVAFLVTQVTSLYLLDLLNPKIRPLALLHLRALLLVPALMQSIQKDPRK